MNLKNYYVVLRRWFQKEDLISIQDASEAIECNWIDENGNRVWVVPPEDEKTITFVWGFNDLDEAIQFYEALRLNEVGMKPSEVCIPE